MVKHIARDKLRKLETPWPVWVEEKQYGTVKPMIFTGTYKDIFEFYCMPSEWRAEYNKTWRCWMNKPTDEERQNDNWEDEEYERG